MARAPNDASAHPTALRHFIADVAEIYISW